MNQLHNYKLTKKLQIRNSNFQDSYVVRNFNISFFFSVKMFCPLLLILVLNSCSTLKPYERVYVDDPEMQMTLTPGKGFEKYVQSIREGSTEATGTKGNGGCGCN